MRAQQSMAGAGGRLSVAMRSVPETSKIDPVPWMVWMIGFVAFGWVTASTSQSPWYASGVVLQLVVVYLSVLLARVVSGRPIRLISALSVIIGSHVLLFILRPSYVMAFEGSVNHFSGVIDDPWSFEAQALAAVGFAFLLLGWAIASRRSRTDPLPLSKSLRPIPVGDWRRYRPWLLAFGAFGVVLWAYQIFSMGWSNYWRLTFSGRSAEYWDYVGGISGYLSTGPRFALGVSLIFLVKNLVDGRRRASAGWLAVTAVLCLPLLSAGSRSSFLPIIFFLLLFVARWRPAALSPVKIAVVLPIVFVLGFVAPRVWRTELSSQSGDLIRSITSAFDPAEFGAEFLGGLDTAMLDSFALQVQAQSSGLLEPVLGTTYLGGLLSFVPRSIWSSKPVTVDEMLNSSLLPAYLDRGTGIAYGFYSEPFFNFSVVGLLIIPLICGLVIGMVTKESEDTDSLLSSYWYALIGGWVFVFMRGNLSFDLQRLVVWALPVVVALVAARLLVKDTVRRNDRRQTSSVELTTNGVARK